MTILVRTREAYDNGEVKNAFITTLGATLSALVLIVVALPAYGATFQLYTLHGFVESLIERGIVPEHMAGKARELANAIQVIDDVHSEEAVVPDHEHVRVSVSQLIEHASRTYRAGGTIDGLLLLATNEHTEDIYPSALRGCQVVYRIYDTDETLLYDRSTATSCKTEEEVRYRLAPGQTRMFEVRHTSGLHPLAPGTYTFVLEYPGYGSGSLEVTVE